MKTVTTKSQTALVADTRPKVRELWTAALGFSLVCALPSAVVAEEFRIETVVYREGQSEPLSENLTLFTDNLIFDFMLKPDRTRFPQEIVIYNSTDRRFVLLDTSRQMKTEFIDGELLKILAALQSSNLVNDDNRFLFHPTFEETYDVGTGRLTLSHPRLTYRVSGKRPPQDAVLPKYYEFIDQFARLNATDPRRMPPFARLKLNLAIRKYGFIPERVEMTLRPTKDEDVEPLRIRAEHAMMWELSDNDRKRIDSAKRYWMDFQKVTLTEFRRIETDGEPRE